MVAHRLNTIIDSDRVLVMDNGEVVEFAPPRDLLIAESGNFFDMIKSLGKNEADRLIKLVARRK